MSVVKRSKVSLDEASRTLKVAVGRWFSTMTSSVATEEPPSSSMTVTSTE